MYSMWVALTNQLIKEKCSHYFGPEGVASKPCIDLKSYRKIYSSVDNLYAWVYNEMKEKNCLFDEALCHIGYNKLNEGFWCDEGCEWFQWIYKYEGGDIAGSDISAFEVDRKLVLKVGGQLHLLQNWHLYLQLKAKSVKVKKHSGKRRMEETGKWFDYLYLSHSTIHNAGIGLFAGNFKYSIVDTSDIFDWNILYSENCNEMDT